MKRWHLIGFGLGTYVIGLVAAAPASLIDAGLEQASSGRLRLAEAQGTLWSGTGQIEIRDRTLRTGLAKHLAWQVLPAYLLRGQFRCDVQLDHAAKRFPVSVFMTRIEVADADINLPALALGLAEPKLAPLGLSGDMLLHITRLSFAQNAIGGTATLQWRGAGSAFTRIAPLGDYELRLEGEGAALRASLRTLQGPIQLDGQGSWKRGTNPLFLGSARIPPQHLQQLRPLMRMFAVERGEGRFELQLS